MGTLTDVIAQAGQPDSREQAIIDRHKSGARKGSLFQDVAEGMAEIEIDTRRQQRDYAEKPTSEIGQIMAAPTKEMISSLGDRAKVLNTIRSLTPEQRQEALRLAPGIAQQLGDDRGGMVGRTLGAVSRGVSHGVSQPIMELAGQVTGNDFGGTAEEIAYIRELDKAASQEFSPARPGDPWYQSGPLQAVEMLPWMATVVGGGGVGRQAATEVAKRVTARAAAGSRVAGAVQAAGQAIGKVPQAVGAKVGLNSVPAIAAGKVGELAGITAAAFPGQYAQEVDSLKALGMVDDTKLRLLAGGTAAITGLVEGLVPNPFKAGNVSLTQGAVKAARQYLWNATKNAPGEMTEEYLQGVTSGLGEHVAQYVGSEIEGVNPAKKKTIEDAFKKGWEQSKEAALPMAFLLGVPAVGGAGLAAARARQGTSVDGMPVEETMPPGATQQPLPTEQQNRDTVSQTTPPALPPTQPPALPPAQQAPAGRASQLEDVISKGFVSSEDATNFGIAGANRKERLANAKAELDGLKSGVTQEQVVPDQTAVESQYAEEVARRRAAKSGVKQPALPEQQPPALPAQKPVRDTVSQNPPLPEPPKQINPGEAVSEFGKGIVDGLYSKVWNDAQSGSLEKMDKPPLFEQLVLKGHKAGVVQSVEDVKSISEGMTGDFEADKKIGIDNLNRLVAKYKEQSPTPAVEPVQDTVSQTEQPKNKGVKPVEPAAPEATVTTSESPTSNATQSVNQGWDVIKGSDGKLYREDPSPNLKPSQRVATRVAVDPKTEGVVLATKDQFGKPIPPETMKARQEFIDGAQEGAAFRRPNFNKNALFEVGKDGKIYSVESTTKRESGSVQSLANDISPGDIAEMTKPESRDTVSRKTPSQSTIENAQRKDSAQEVSIGTNSQGEPIFEDKDGVRSVGTGDTRVTEPVIQLATPRVGPNSTPLRDRESTPWIDKESRDDRFKTTKEKPVEAKSRDTVSQEVKPEPENKDAPQPKRGGDPNGQVETEKQAEAQAKADGRKELLGDKGGQAAGETPSSDSSAEKKTQVTKEQTATKESAKKKKKEKAKKLLARYDDNQLGDVAKRLGLESTDREAITESLLGMPEVMEYLESRLPKSKPTKPASRRPKPADSSFVPAQLGKATVVTPEKGSVEEKQTSILKKMGVTLRSIVGGNQNLPGLFDPKTMTIWINRDYTQKRNTAWGLFAHEAFHAMRVSNPKAWAKLNDWVKEYEGKQDENRLKASGNEYLEDLTNAFNESLQADIDQFNEQSDGRLRIPRDASIKDRLNAAKAAGVAISESTKATAYYINEFNTDEDVRDDESLSRYLEDRASDFNFWNDLGNSNPSLLAKIGQWLRKVLRFAKPDTLAGQVRLAIESAMESNGISPSGARAAAAKSGFSTDNIKVNEVRAKDRPGKRVSKGLSVKTVKGKQVLEETEDLSLEYVKKNTPQVFIKNANIIAKYPLVSGKQKFKNAATTTQAQAVYDVFVREAADNLNYLLNEYNPELKNLSTLWYDGANSIANELAIRFKVSPEQAAGIIAAMSPQKDWYQNVRISELLLEAFEINPAMTQEMVNYQREVVRVAGLDIVESKVRKAEKGYKKSRSKKNKESLEGSKDYLLKAIKKADEVVSMLESYVGKKLDEVPKEVQPYMVRLYHEINTTKDYNVIAPDGSVIDVARNFDGSKSRVAWGSFSEIGKAVSIRNDGSQENITRSLGVMHKIRNFYNNIIDPMSKDSDVTMDTHTIAAALLMPLSGASAQVGHNFGSGGVANSGPFGIKGLYYAFAEAYNLSAKENGLLPRQVQSATWDPVRGLFTDVFKSDKKNVAKIDSIWKEYQDGETTVDEARKRVFEEAGGINDPTWARPVYSESRESVREEGVRKRGRRDGQDSVGSTSRKQRAAVGQRPESTGDGRGRDQSRKLTPLTGSPSVPGINGPDPQVVAVAERYAKENGIDLKRQAEYVKVDPERAKRIADAYEQMAHAPQDPKVKAAYQDLIKQTTAQYKAFEDAGYRFWFMDLEVPSNAEYASSPYNALRDLRSNKQMGVFPTSDGFGTSDLDVNGNPLLEDTGIKWPSGSLDGPLKPVTANDLFRAVHDAFGHSLEGAGFRARGEENAWQAHVRLFTGSAVAAITSETRGQNSWLNYGPYGDKNRDAKVEDTTFADQKTGLMPEWTWTEGRAADFDYSETNEESSDGVTKRDGRRAAVTRGDLHGDSGQDRRGNDQEGRSETPAYGKAREGAVSYVGRHYSPHPRESLSSVSYGTGVSRFSGGESRRLRNSNDDRIKRRIYFYIETAGSIKPEMGVGSFTHEVKLDNLYDADSKLIERGNDSNKFESDVIDAGFDGYISKDYGMAVLLGPQHTSVPMRRATEYDEGASNDSRELGFDPRTPRYAVARPEVAKKLDAGKKVTLYRAMTMIDGKLYPPMSSKIGDGKGKLTLRKPEPIGQWMQAEERPDLVPTDGPNAGKFPLKKPGGGTTWAAYAPYFHASSIPLNDQFTAAWKNDGVDRPQLVMVEVEVPESEMTDGYQAKGSPKKTGFNKWNSGVVASKLPGGREVALSRYLRIKRVVPDSEIAKKIADIVNPNRLSIPENTVTPQLRAELEKNGVRISPKGTKGEAIRYAPSRKDDVLSGLLKHLENRGVIKPLKGQAETTSTKHAKTDELRAKRKLPERLAPTPESFDSWEEQARRDYPNAAARLKVIAQAERNPEQVGKIENAVIGQHIVDLENRREAGEDVMDELLRIIKVANVVGTEAGRALVSRKAERYGDFSLAGLVNEHIGTVGKEPTAKQMHDYAELADRIKQLESDKTKLAEKLAKEAIARKKAEETPKPPKKKIGTKRASILKKVADGFAAFQNAWGGGTSTRAAVSRHGVADSFKKWFRDSKVVDENGDPLVMYHGTDKDFNVFENRGGKVTVLFSTFDVERKGFFFAKDKGLALEYGKKLVPVYLSIQKPANFLDSKEWSKIKDGLVEKGWNERYLDRTDAWEMFDVGDGNDGAKLIADLKSMGYDGAIIEEPSWQDEDGEYGVAHVAFDNTQIKSATSNVGTFDPTNPDIRYSPGRQEPDIKTAAAGLVASLREMGVSSDLELESQVKANIPNVTPEQMQAIKDAWDESIKKTKLESPLGNDPEPAAIGARAKELMKLAIEAEYGATPETWKEVVDIVHSQLSIEVSGISEADTMQAMSDYGVWRALNQEEVAVKTRAIRGKVRQSLKIEDALKAIEQSKEWLKDGVSPEEVARRLRDQNLLPKATGQEQATPDSIERELIAEFNKLKKDLPVSAESKEGQLKSALSTAKTAGQNRLELLDKDIEQLEEAVNKREALVKPVTERNQLKPDDELTEIRKQLEDRKKKRAELKAEYETIFPPTKKQRLTTAEQQTERALNSIEKLKEKLQKVKEGKDISPTKQPDLVASEIRAEIKTWQDRLQAAKQAAAEAEAARYEGEGGPSLPPVGRKQLTDEQKLEASKRMLQKQINAVRTETIELRNGTWMPAIKGASPTSATKEAMKAGLAILKEARDEARKASPDYQARQEAKYWEQYRKGQERRLAFWEKRRDDAAAGILPTPRKKRTITEEAILDKNLEIEKVQYEAMYEIEKANRANWNAGQWIGQGLLEVTSLIPKTLMLGMEMSFVLRQGFFYSRSHPIKAFMALVEAIPAVWSQRLALAAMESIESRPNAKEYLRGDVEFTKKDGPKAKLEEMFQSSVIQWLENTETKWLAPLRTWVKAYGAFERGNRTFANIMKADLYDIQKRDTLAAREFFGTNTDWTESDIKETGRITNIFSGRGTGLKGGSPWLDFVFLARRWMWSRIQADFVVPFQLATPEWIGQWNADRGMRVALAKLYLQTLTGHAAKMAMGYFVYSLLAGDDDDEKPTFEWDPRSSDAWAMKVGETRFKDEGGLMPAIVLASRIATGKIKTADGELKSIYGNDVEWGGRDAADFIIDFARYKIGTGPSAILEWASGRDAVGNPVTKTGIITSRLTPLTWREIAAAEEELGVAKGTLASLEAYFGVSVSTRGDRTKYRQANEADQKKQFDKDIKKMKFDSPDPAYKEFLSEEQKSEVDERREERKQGLVYAASAEPIRKDFKNDDTYNQAVKERDTAMEDLKKSGFSMDEARSLLIKHWEDNYGSAKEVRKGIRVYKEALSDRLKRLRKVFAE